MIKELSNIYKGKRVFLTGHTGFKGAWMLKILSILKCEVRGFALETKNNNDLQISVNSDFFKSDPIPEYPKKFLFLEFSLEGHPEKTYNIAYPTHTFLNFKLF